MGNAALSETGMKQRLAAILAADAVTQGRRMRFRIGLHLGEIIEKADGSAYGDGINIAARIQSVAEPDSVCFSQRVYDHGTASSTQNCSNWGTAN